MTLHFWGIALCHLLRAVTQELIIKLTRYRPERRRSSCIKSLNSRLNALIAPGVNRTKNGPGLKKKKMLLSNTCANHIRLWLSFDGYVFIFLKPRWRHSPHVSGWRAQLPTLTLFKANMAAMCARAERRGAPPAAACLPAPILALVCVRVWAIPQRACVCVRVCRPASAACCLIASILTQPHQTCSYAVQHPGAISPMWFGACAVSCSCRHVVTLCLYSPLVLKDLWLNNDAEKRWCDGLNLSLLFCFTASFVCSCDTIWNLKKI